MLNKDQFPTRDDFYDEPAASGKASRAQKKTTASQMKPLSTRDDFYDDPKPAAPKRGVFRKRI